MSDWDSTLWMQNDPGYSAREDRLLIEQVADGIEHVVTGLVVSQRGAGANLSVDVSPGVAFIEGDDQSNQGFYLARLLNTVNVAVTAAPGAGVRIDTVVLQVRDPQAGGPAGDDSTIEVVAGIVGGGPPALPDSAIALAYLTRTAGDATVTTAMIADERPFRGGHVIVMDREPVQADGVDGDVFFVVPSA